MKIEWTEPRSCKLVMEYGHSHRNATVEDIGRVIEALSPEQRRSIGVWIRINTRCERLKAVDRD